MRFLIKKIIIAIFLLLIALLVFSQPIGEKLEEKKIIKLKEICSQVSKETKNFQYLKKAFEGYDTFKVGGMASFSAIVDRTLEFTSQTKRELAEENFPEKMKDFQNQCQTENSNLNQDLQKIKPTFDYLTEIYSPYKNFKDSLEQVGQEGYSGFVDKLREVKEYQKNFEKDLNTLANLTSPQEFEESHLYLKKSLSGIVDFWNNAEVAIVRKTPYIFSSAFWVCQRDWQQLEKTMIEELSFSL